jgi:bifunctional UDP-N-acetylglucosamine pyrophosphorylase/glucosamine-1-phosphate N-acetyltransferase
LAVASNQNRRVVGAVILAAGMGTRMRSALPKVLHAVGGKPMVRHVLDTVRALNAERMGVVVAPDHLAVTTAVQPTPTAVQQKALGTAHAALAAAGLFANFNGDIFILFGDTPLIRQETLQAMLDRRAASDAPSVVVLGMRPANENAYGRLILGADGYLDRIVEFKDANADERAEELCNSGVMLVDGAKLFDLLGRVGNDNAKGEYYLTDIVELARKDGDHAAVVEGAESELLGINDRVDLASAEAEYQRRQREMAMRAGATLTAPETVFFSHDVEIGRDVIIEPNVVFGPGARIESGATIRAFSHVEGARVAAGAVIGPYARLRPGADIGESVRIGNFVEVKASTIEAGAKANHLAYIGDARVGAGANIGAGTITCNYDGFDKHKTDIGEGAFIGSNSSLIAPVKIGNGAIVAAGSALSGNVPANALGLVRAEQSNRPGWAEAFRARKAKQKAAKTASATPKKA